MRMWYSIHVTILRNDLSTVGGQNICVKITVMTESEKFERNVRNLDAFVASDSSVLLYSRNLNYVVFRANNRLDMHQGGHCFLFY